MGNIASILVRAISDVIERMCFLLPDPDAGDSAAEDRDYCSASIGITGQPRLRITISVDHDLVRLLASNALGAGEPGVEEVKTGHFLLEMTNVIGGKFLLAWEEAQGRDLTMPVRNADEVFGGLTTDSSISVNLYYDSRRLNGQIDIFS